MSWPQIYDALSTLSLAQWVVAVILLIATHVIAYFVFIRWVMRRSWKLHQHLKRSVVLLRPITPSGDTLAGGDLSNELLLLQRNSFLNVRGGITDYRTFNPTHGHCLVVLGYKPEMAGIQDVLNRIKSKHVPLIVYTYGNNAVTGPDKAALDTYPYTLYANFPLTLLNSIFSTVASYPYDRRDT